MAETKSYRRFNRYSGKKMIPDGNAEETMFPRANPGQLPYLRPRDPGPKIATNTGKK